MRRAEREVIGIENITKIIDECKVLSLGLCENNMPYVVPMNFGYEAEGDTITIYLHCSKIGKKLDIIRANPNVCIEMNTEHELISGEKGCDFGFKFASVIGFGKAEFITDFDEKIHGFRLLMKHQANLPEIELDERIVNATEGIKVTLEKYTGKRRDK